MPTELGREAAESGLTDSFVQASADEYNALQSRIKNCKTQIARLLEEIDQEILIHRVRQLKTDSQTV